MKNQMIFSACLLAAGAGLIAKAQTKPNIIVIKTDDQRWDSLGCYDHPLVKTPNIDALATEGIRFKNAFTVAPLCVPSRTSFFSGQYATRNQRFDNKPESHIAPEQFSFIQVLKDSGYRTGLCGKNHTFQHAYVKKWFDCFEEYSPWGKAFGTLTESDKAVRKFRSTSGPPSQLGRLLLEGLIDEPEPFPEEQCMASRIADDSIEFINQCGSDPFFLHMSFPAPHWPNVVCEPYFSMYKNQLDEISLAGMDEIDWDSHPFAHYVQSQCAGFDTMSKEDRRKILAVMLGQISFIDKSVGRLVDSLKEKKLYDNTLVVFTSDQGCFGGQFGLPCKTKGFYESLIRVPLIIKMPCARAQNRSSSAQISNIDVMPTLLDAAGISYGEKIDGLSFLPVITGATKTHRKAIYSEIGLPIMPPAPISKEDYPAYNEARSQEDMFWFIEYTTRGRCAMIREDGWKYVYYNGDMEELYHYEEDPLELENLAYHPEHLERKKHMHEQLIQQGFAGIEPIVGIIKF